VRRDLLPSRDGTARPAGTAKRFGAAKLNGPAKHEGPAKQDRPAKQDWPAPYEEPAGHAGRAELDGLAEANGPADLDGPAEFAGPTPIGGPAELHGQATPPRTDVTVVRDVEPYDEPTWEVRKPNGRPGLDRRTKAILSVAAATAIVVNAGAAWAYWKVTASETGGARAGTAVHLTLRGRSDLDIPLHPGHTGNMTVTLINDNDFPVRITSVTPGRGNVVADDEHRDAGCLDTGVSMTKDAFAVSWNVTRNNVAAYTVPNALHMDARAKRACIGATFTVPLQTSGVSGR
jgi:hypothetical protein